MRVSHFEVPFFLVWREEPCKNIMTGDDALVEILSVSQSCCIGDAVFSKDMLVINKGKVLDAVHSLEAQRLLVAQGVYCIRPKCKAKAKESPKFKFSSKCPDFLEKKTERKIELFCRPIGYQNSTKPRNDIGTETSRKKCHQ